MKQLKRIKKTKKGHKTLPTIYFFWISLTELLKQAHS